MTVGPVQVIVFGFDRTDQFRGEVLEELANLRGRGLIRLLDLFLALKNLSGDIVAVETNDLTEQESVDFGRVAGKLLGVSSMSAAELAGAAVENILAATSHSVGLDYQGLRKVVEDLPQGKAFGVLMFEHTWAIPLRDAIRRAGGIPLAQGFITPELRALLITGATSILVGLMVYWSRKLPRFNLLLPVAAAILASTLVFNLTRLGYVFGSVNLLITPLITFLPGALLTTGMIELASMHILSGSARLIYGATILLFLFIGISIGISLSGLASYQVYAYEAVFFPWWAPILGTLLFGIGTFVRLSGANRDLFWILLVLYAAMLGQSFGEHYVNSYFGTF